MKTRTFFAIASLTLLLVSSSLAGVDEGNFEQLTVLGHVVDPELKTQNQPVAAAKTAGTSQLLVDFSDGVEVIFCIPSGGDASFENTRRDPTETVVFSVPPGSYDVVAYWGVQLATVVVEEDIVVDGDDVNITMDRRSAVHQFSVQPYDIDDAVLRSDSVSAQFLFTRDGVSRPIIDFSRGASFFGGDALAFVKSAAFSSMSEDYQIDIQMICGAPNVGRGHAYYFFGDYSRGIEDHHRVEFSSEDWKPIVIDHNPGLRFRSLMFSTSSSNTPIGDPHDEFVGAGTIHCSAPKVPFDKSFQQKVYMQSMQGADRNLGFMRLLAYPYSSSCPMFYRSALYESGYLKFDDGLKAYVRGSDALPIFETDEMRFPLGLGTLFWYGRMDNDVDTLRIVPAHGRYLLPFIAQTGSFPGAGIYELQGRLIENGAVVSEFDVDLEGHLLAWPVQDEIEIEIHGTVYNLELEYSDKFFVRFGPKERRAWVSLQGDLSLDDSNPPYLRRFTITANNRVVDAFHVGSGQVEIHAFDDASGISHLRAGYLSGDYAGQLPIRELSAHQWIISIPAGLKHEKKATLWVEAVDNSGNSMTSHLILPVAKNSPWRLDAANAYNE